MLNEMNKKQFFSSIFQFLDENNINDLDFS